MIVELRGILTLADADPLFRLELEYLIAPLADAMRAFDALPDAMKRAAAQIDRTRNQ